MGRFVLFFLSTFVISCSSIHFKTSEVIPMTFNQNEDHTENVSVEIKKYFYLWGLLPSRQTVNLDEVFARKGYKEVSSVEIEEIDETSKAMWMIFTFGLYYPNSYLVKGKYRI